MKEKQLTKRILLAILGLSIIGFGIAITIKANLGVDPASVLQTGLAKQLNTSYGNANVLTCIVIISIIFFVDKKYLSIATFLALFLIAYVADFSLYLFSGITLDTILLQVIALLSGTMLVGLGVAIYSQVNLGVGAIDSVSMLISDKTQLEYRWVRMVCDFGFLLIGILLQGSIGIGTIVIAILTGPSIQWFLPYTKFVKE